MKDVVNKVQITPKKQCLRYSEIFIALFLDFADFVCNISEGHSRRSCSCS